MWFGLTRIFTAALDHLTRLTGNYKKFPTLVAMIIKAMSQKEASTVNIDLYTRTQLELLYSKKNVGDKLTKPQHANARYLILTYKPEFDK